MLKGGLGHTLHAFFKDALGGAYGAYLLLAAWLAAFFLLGGYLWHSCRLRDRLVRRAEAESEFGEENLTPLTRPLGDRIPPWLVVFPALLFAAAFADPLSLCVALWIVYWSGAGAANRGPKSGSAVRETALVLAGLCIAGLASIAIGMPSPPAVMLVLMWVFYRRLRPRGGMPTGTGA